MFRHNPEDFIKTSGLPSSTTKFIYTAVKGIMGTDKMDEFQAPTCSHDNTPMTRVWSDGHGNALYQCPACGRKTNVQESGNRR